MKTAYFDCSSGISGDMCLGALVNAGAPLSVIKRRLRGLHLRGYDLAQKKVLRAGLAATKVDVTLRSRSRSAHDEILSWPDAKRLIGESALEDNIKKKGLHMFRRLFQAEATAHGKPVNKVHLHELGAVDCLVDIFGTLIALDILGIEKIFSSEINLGSGTVHMSHGILPVPAPATVELLKGIPVYASDIKAELSTPTGAVIISSLAEGFGRMPVMIPDAAGIGAGSKDFRDRPNILRVFIGDTVCKEDSCDIIVIETNIDDMNPQIYEYLAERLYNKGALDIFLTQIIMKKMRPAVKLTVLCEKDLLQLLAREIFRETTSIGLRYYPVSRTILKRDIRKIKTRYGRVKMKITSLDEDVIKAAPEYEECKKIAVARDLPLRSVISEAEKTWATENKKKKQIVQSLTQERPER